MFYKRDEMKILGCDYDGTLNYGGIDDAKRAAIKKWQAQGNKLGVVSGRGPDWMAVVNKELGVTLDFFVAFNGGIIVGADGKVICKTACENVNPKDLTADLFAWGCDFAHVNSDAYYLIRRDKKAVGKGEYCLEELTLPTLIYQVSVQMKTEQEAAEITALVAEKYGERLTPLQNGICVDIVPKGVRKAYGMYKTQALFNAKKEDVIVVGDNFNDEDMLKEFYSYAMENGVEEMKRIATHVTKSVTQLIERELAR